MAKIELELDDAHMAALWDACEDAETFVEDDAQEDDVEGTDSTVEQENERRQQVRDAIAALKAAIAIALGD